MSTRSIVLSTIALGVLLVSPAGAQQPRPASAPAQPPEVLPPSDGQQGGSGPAAEGEDKKNPVVPAAGYAYSDKPAATRVARSRYRAHGPTVNIPGFEQVNDGGSRLFVQLSQSVPVEERKTPGGITYVLKGASPRVWNNTNALVTIHFNTPVSRARLVPQGHDLHFIVELRAGVTPTWKMNEAQDKTAMLAIDFPKGDYLQLGTAEGAGQPSTPPPPRAARGPRRGTRAPAARRPETGPKP